jgi:hypothetical protein
MLEVTVVNWSYWSPFRPWAPRKAEVIRILEQVLDGTLDCRVWDDFIHIPMKADPELEAIRRACEALTPEETVGPNGAPAFTERARTELQRLLASVKR